MGGELMAWVRYDDQFHENRKVTAVILEDPGALALHVLANTWTNAQKHVGFVPLHQPAMLLCDRGLGAKWSALLVQNGLWHERGKECERCREHYADLPAELAGYVIHDIQYYLAPARERQTPGTPAEISAKRAAAGRKGGRSTATRREQTQQNARANEANGASKSSKPSSKRVSPVPVPGPDPGFASNEANLSPSVGDAPTSRPPQEAQGRKTSKGADAIVAAFLDAGTAAEQDAPTKPIIGKVARDAKRLLVEEKVDFERLLEAARRMGNAGWNSLDIQLQRMSAERVANGRSPRDSRSVSTEESLMKGWEPDEIAS
jgi:hypothetical protein